MRIRLDRVNFESGAARLIDQVSCELEPGRCTLVMGPSGSGKTLLMKIMAGILPPSDGSVYLDERDILSFTDKELNRRRLDLGFVFQDAALWQNTSVLQNLMLPTQYHFPARPAAHIQERVDRLCAVLGFREDLSQRPAVLSSGERKVASIIRALMLDPQTVFMDEPTGGLDAGTSTRLIEHLRSLKEQGKSLVLAGHNSEVASQLADDILVIDDGRLLAFDSVQTLVRTNDERVKEILVDVFDLTSTYDADILDILGSSDDPFT